jgi:hypothetical protein
MPRGVQISDEVRAKVIAELLAGAAVNATARKYSLPKSTVSRIRSEVAPEQLEQVGTEKRQRIDDLLLECISVHVEATIAIARHVSTKEFLAAKSAESIVEVHREMSDTALRLLEAASAAEPEGEATDPAG